MSRMTIPQNNLMKGGQNFSKIHLFQFSPKSWRPMIEHLLSTNHIKIKTVHAILTFCIYCLAAPKPTLGYYQRDSLFHQMLITAYI